MTAPSTLAGGTVSTPERTDTSILSGKTETPTPTAVSSVTSKTRPKNGRKPTKRRARREQKVGASTRLSIVQSALASLGEVMEVYVREEDGNLIVTIVKCGLEDDKTFVIK